MFDPNESIIIKLSPNQYLSLIYFDDHPVNSAPLRILPALAPPLSRGVGDGMQQGID
jgi:hypothetical protein